MPDLLDDTEVAAALSELDGWSGGADGITRTVTLDDDRYGDFRIRLTEVTDAMNHHADISRTGDTVELGLVTHSAGGVTTLDITLAARIDELLRP